MHSPLYFCYAQCAHISLSLLRLEIFYLCERNTIVLILLNSIFIFDYFSISTVAAVTVSLRLFFCYLPVFYRSVAITVNNDNEHLICLDFNSLGFVISCFLFHFFPHLLQPFLHSLYTFLHIPKWICEIEKKTHQNEQKKRRIKAASTHWQRYFMQLIAFSIYTTCCCNQFCVYTKCFLEYLSSLGLYCSFRRWFTVCSLRSYARSFNTNSVEFVRTRPHHICARATRSVHNFLVRLHATWFHIDSHRINVVLVWYWLIDIYVYTMLMMFEETCMTCKTMFYMNRWEKNISIIKKGKILKLKTA